jgi:2-C-methyl-D-erythritol 4-phosphate cytidylyltransferase
MKVEAVIVAAGKGIRFGEGKKKQFQLLSGKPILAHTLDRFEACPTIKSILLVTAQEDMNYCLEEIVEKYKYKKISQIIPGGRRRQESVKNGIDFLTKDTEIVVIHDGVRPLVTREMIEESIQSANRFGAVVFAMPVKETIKMVQKDGTIVKTLDREYLWQVQTPQTFQAKIIKQAYQKAQEDGFLGTDDASLVERLGIKVHILPGSYINIKVTTPEDLALANFYLNNYLKKGDL